MPGFHVAAELSTSSTVYLTRMSFCLSDLKVDFTNKMKLVRHCKLCIKSRSLDRKHSNFSVNLCVCVCFCADGGIIAGAIIAAVVICVLIAALLYYLFSVKGYKVGGMRMQTRPANANAVSGELVRCGWL